MRHGQEPEDFASRMPEGAQMRFADHVVSEIDLGNFEYRQGWLHREPYLISLGRWELKRGQEKEFNQTFSLFVRSRWFGLAKPYVLLKRGSDKIDLWPTEEQALAAAWERGLKTWQVFCAEEKAKAERERQRAAWWP